MATIIQITIPRYIANFLPTRSAIFPEKGLEIAADIVNKVMISPFLSGAPNLVIKSFNSGMIKLKLVIKITLTMKSTKNFYYTFLAHTKVTTTVVNF